MAQAGGGSRRRRAVGAAAVGLAVAGAVSVGVQVTAGLPATATITGVVAAGFVWWGSSVQERLQRSEDRAWQVIETAADAFVEIDERSRITLWNAAAVDLFGWQADEVRGLPITDVLIPERYREAHEAGLHRFLTTGRSRILGEPIEISAIRRDGSEVEVELVVWFAPQADGEVRFDAFIRDVTARSRAASAVRASERRLRQAEEVAGLGTWEFDVTTGVVAWSPGAFRINDRDPETFVPSYEGWLGTVHPEDRDRAIAAVNDALASGDRYEVEYRMVRQDGGVRRLLTVGTVERSEDGRPLRLLGAARDVTEERELERMKDEFVAVASHELRTPLTSIHGALTLIETGAFGELPGDAAELISVATRNTYRLVRLIDDLLDVQRLSAGKVSLRTEVVDLAWLLAEAVSTMRGQADAAEVSLVTAVGDDVGLVVDPDRLLQVLTNVVGNAIRFSSPGDEVVVRGVRHEAGVTLSVEDHGLGIPPDKTARIFERFRQADTSDARERDGSGLGLTIAKELVELHGGTIRADSAGLGHGTCVSIDLPVSRIASRGDREEIALICDDNPDLRFLTVERLQQLGYDTIEAGSGSEAVSLFSSVRPALVLMDILLPDGDGRDAIRRMRSAEGGAEAAIVVLSALDPPVDERASGADAWLTKPATMRELGDCIARVTRPPSVRDVVKADRGGVT